jgi:hypothetical protein
MTEGLGLLMLTELPRTLGQGFHGQQLTILRLGERAHFDQLRSLAKKHLNSELRTAKFGAGYLAPCPTIRRSLPAPDKRTISEPNGMSQTCQIGDIAAKRPPNKAPYVVGRDGQSWQANMTTRNAVDYRPISMISQIIKNNATENSGE